MIWNATQLVPLKIGMQYLSPLQGGFSPAAGCSDVTAAAVIDVLAVATGRAGVLGFTSSSVLVSSRGGCLFLVLRGARRGVGRISGSRQRSGVERGESRRSLSDIGRRVDARDARPSGVHTGITASCTTCTT